MASATERKRVSRRRKKLGKMVCQVEVSSQEIDFLRRRGYGPRQGFLSSAEAASEEIRRLNRQGFKIAAKIEKQSKIWKQAFAQISRKA